MNALLHLSTQQKREKERDRDRERERETERERERGREGEADLTGVGDANGAREEQSGRQQLPHSLEAVH